MRVISCMALLTFWLPAAALADTDIAPVCYTACESSTNSNPEFKACLARAADKADQQLNQGYKVLQGAIRAAAKEMGQDPGPQLTSLTSSQKTWIAFRDSSCTFEDTLAFGGTAIGGNYSACLCALSYARVNDFERIKKHVLFADE
jgi:uncharacterized protein YecT (DUF1311 family)